MGNYCGHSDYRPICERCEIDGLKLVNSDLLDALEGMLQIFGVTEASLTGNSDVHAVEVECCNVARKAMARAKGEAE